MIHSHYMIASAVWSTVMFVIWRRGTWLNLAFKFVFLGLAIWGWYLVLHG